MNSSLPEKNSFCRKIQTSTSISLIAIKRMMITKMMRMREKTLRKLEKKPERRVRTTWMMSKRTT